MFERAFGGRIVVTLDDGTVIEDELDVADAHPAGARPFARAQYVEKFRRLADGVIGPVEQDRFLDCAQALLDLEGRDLGGLTVRADSDLLSVSVPTGIFDR